MSELLARMIAEGEAEEGLRLVPGKRQPLSDQLYGQILEQIVSGRLREGDRLPPEKDISQMFGVSRPVVRQALLRLRVDGLIQARQGAGTFVMARPADRLTQFTRSDQVAEFLRCLEIRLPLEGAAARFAAERRTPAQLQRITAAHEALRAEAMVGRMSPDSDLAFHTAIAAASGNDLFVAVLTQLHETLRGMMSLALNLTRTGSRERTELVLAEHKAILQAIEVQDAEAAQIAMQYHIGQARRRMIDRKQD